MNSFQIILGTAGILLLTLWVKKFFQNISIKQYTAAEIQEKIKLKDPLILLDVRTKFERNSGAIRGSIHIPLNELSERLKEIEMFRESEIVCYCLSGNRSLSAASKLKKLGFNAANLKGGISQWNTAKLK